MVPKKVAAPAEVKSSGASGAKKTMVKLKTPSHPSTLSMVVEALKKTPDRKGTSVQAIRNYILLAHPTVDPVRLKLLLKNALNRGIEKGILIRPTNSTASGATGRFKLAQTKAKSKVEGENVEPNVQPKEKLQKTKKVVKKVSKKPKAAKGEPKDESPKEGTGADEKSMPPEAKASTSKPKKEATKTAMEPARKPKSKAPATEEGAKAKKEPAKREAEAPKAENAEEKPTAKSRKGKK